MCVIEIEVGWWWWCVAKRGTGETDGAKTLSDQQQTLRLQSSYFF